MGKTAPASIFRVTSRPARWQFWHRYVPEIRQISPLFHVRDEFTRSSAPRGAYCGKEMRVCQKEKRGDGVTPRERVRKKGIYLFPFFIFPPFLLLAAFFFLGMATHLPSRLAGKGSR
jgi:hypothetical protein